MLVAGHVAGVTFLLVKLALISAIRTGPATFIEVGCLTLVEVVAAVRVEGASVLVGEVTIEDFSSRLRLAIGKPKTVKAQLSAAELFAISQTVSSFAEPDVTIGQLSGWEGLPVAHMTGGLIGSALISIIIPPLLSFCQHWAGLPGEYSLFRALFSLVHRELVVWRGVPG